MRKATQQGKSGPFLSLISVFECSHPSFKEKLRPGKYNLERPRKILVYCKAFDDEIIPLFLQLFKYVIDLLQEIMLTQFFTATSMISTLT